ncbi:MAG: pentapeptide repeat-containing protein [Microcoleaceae cyanobacterium]
MPGADLREADLTGVSLKMTKLEGANLKGAYLNKSELQAVEINRSLQLTNVGQSRLIKISQSIRKNNLNVDC